MVKHIYKDCKCKKVGCIYCDGGLLYCEVCGGFEGSLTTECCGRRLTREEEDRIYIHRNLDFINSKFVNETTSLLK